MHSSDSVKTHLRRDTLTGSWQWDAFVFASGATDCASMLERVSRAVRESVLRCAEYDADISEKCERSQVHPGSRKRTPMRKGSPIICESLVLSAKHDSFLVSQRQFLNRRGTDPVFVEALRGSTMSSPQAHLYVRAQVQNEMSDSVVKLLQDHTCPTATSSVVKMAEMDPNYWKCHMRADEETRLPSATISINEVVFNSVAGIPSFDGSLGSCTPDRRKRQKTDSSTGIQTESSAQAVYSVRISVKGGGSGGFAVQSRVKTLGLCEIVSKFGGSAIRLSEVVNKCLLLFSSPTLEASQVFSESENESWGPTVKHPDPRLFYLTALHPSILSRHGLSPECNRQTVSISQQVQQTCAAMGKENVKCVVFSTYNLGLRRFCQDYCYLLDNQVPVMILHGDRQIRFNYNKNDETEVHGCRNSEDGNDATSSNIKALPGDCMMHGGICPRPKSVSRSFPELVPSRNDQQMPRDLVRSSRVGSSRSSIASESDSSVHTDDEDDYDRSVFPVSSMGKERKSHAPTVNSTKLLAVLYHELLQRHWELYDIPASLEIYSMCTWTRRALHSGLGVHHSKFVLIFCNTGLRTIVTSANLGCATTTDSVWTQWFPAVQQQGANLRPPIVPEDPRQNFGHTLCHYLMQVDRIRSLHANTAPDLISRFLSKHLRGSTKTIAAALSRYDFSGATVALTTSIPSEISVDATLPISKHRRYDSDLPVIYGGPGTDAVYVTGYQQVRGYIERLSTLYPLDECARGKSDSQSTTACLGELILQPTSITANITPGVWSRFLAAHMEPGEDCDIDKVKIIWPTKSLLSGMAKELASLSNGGSFSGTLFLPAMALRQLIEHSVWYHFCEYVPKIKSRAKVLPHIKGFIRLYDESGEDKNPSEESGVTNRVRDMRPRARWMKLGSDCLSNGAQGHYPYQIAKCGAGVTRHKNQSDPRAYVVRNFEMGVMFFETPKCELRCGYPPSVEDIGSRVVCTMPVPYATLSARSYFNTDEHGDEYLRKGLRPYMSEDIGNGEVWPWSGHSDSNEKLLNKEDELASGIREAGFAPHPHVQIPVVSGIGTSRPPQYTPFASSMGQSKETHASQTCPGLHVVRRAGLPDSVYDEVTKLYKLYNGNLKLLLEEIPRRYGNQRK